MRYMRALILTLSIGGSTLYLKLASAGWRDPAEHGEIPVTGEPFVWAASLPILLIVILLNVVWGVVLVSRRPIRSAATFSVSVLVLIGSVIVDFAHH